MHPTRTLASRVVLMAVLVALASVLITGIATIGLYRQGATQAARATLARDADTIAATTAGIDQRRTVRARRIQTAALRQVLNSRQIILDQVDGDEAAASAGLGTPFTPADVDAVRQTGTLSTQRTVAGRSYLIEGRTSGTSALLMAQPVNEALAQSRLGSRRLVIPLVLGLLGGGLAGLVMARQIAAPLRRLSTAARRLSGGDRTVRLPPEGPREVADVAQALNGLAAALSDSEARQRRFLMNVSHELRTPLTAVTGYAEGLADGVITGPDVVPAGTVIRDEAARLDRRVDDLLALARMEADDFRLQLAPADLAELVRTAGRAWQPRAQTAGIRLRLAADGPPVVVVTDAERLRQAIDALADNALRVLSAGNTLTFGCGMQQAPAGSDDASAAWIEVSDDGPGLADEDLAVAFDRGRLTERYRGERPVGSGLGLALVGELARRLGGLALARRSDQGGVSFYVVLPVELPVDPDTGEQTVPTAWAPPAEAGPNPNTARTFHELPGHPASG